ncbi:protein NLRC5-like isoform X1 [Ptychodera flava]|uniref:protein NLRC5-like isoform X1 n=1 Tax=Ptychodera flava TaxID=63121 RepID=UPI00396A89AC
MEMFINTLSFMPHLEKLSLTGFGEKLCEQFLLFLSEETVSLNINTLCLAGNDLSWKHCRLLSEVLNAMPCLASLDLRRNSIGSLGCTELLQIRDQLEVRVDDNNIAHVLLEILPLCTSSAQLEDVGHHTLKSLDDIARFIRSLGNVRHIDCTKLSNSQLSKLCQNLSLLSNIESIDLSRSKLNKQIVLLLSENLKHLKNLKKVDLSHCCVSRDDMNVLLQEISPEVTDLNLSNTNMSDLLLDKLKRFNNLKQLKLSNNKLKANDHIFRFIPTSVTHLNLSHNNLHGCSFEKLDSYTQLEDLDVSHNKFTFVDDGFKRMEESFKHLTQLKQLNLSNIGLESCINLSLPSSITKLDLSHNQITDIGQSFNHLTQLTHLDVSHNKVNQSLIDILKCLPTTARYLDFSSNCIDNVGNVGKVISSFNDLTFINLGSNTFSDTGIQNPTIQYLDVSFNKIQDVNQLGKLMSDFSQLYYMNLSSNRIDAVGVHTLFSETENCNSACDIDVSHNLSGLQKIVSQIVSQLPESTSLPDFDKSNLLLKDEKLQECFRNIPKVTAVDISKNKEWSETDYESMLNDLSVFYNMERLKLTIFNPFTCHKLANSLKYFSNLRHLDVSGSNIDNQGLKDVGESLLFLKRLQYVNFSNTYIDMKGVEILLNIQRTHVSKPFINVANNIHYLPAIFPYIEDQLSGSAIDDIDFDSNELPVQSFANVVQMTHLTKLTVKDKHWVDGDFKCFEQGLKDLNLSSLDLSHNNMGCKGAMSVSLGIRSMDGLTYLDLSHNNIRDIGAMSLSEGIGSMDGLTHLDLSHNNIGERGGMSLSEGMRSMDELTHIDLSHNYIGDSGTMSLSEVMRSIAKLTHLDLSHNNIGDYGAWGVSLEMTSVDALTYLNLSHNNIGEKGAMSLSGGIWSLRRLTHLDLSHNNIGESGAKSLSEGMRSLKGLPHLDISHNNIG